jgi:hypothetical protein
MLIVYARKHRLRIDGDTVERDGVFMLTLPTPDELSAIERDCHVRFPEAFRRFVLSPQLEAQIDKVYPGGQFIRTANTLRTLSGASRELKVPFFFSLHKSRRGEFNPQPVHMDIDGMTLNLLGNVCFDVEDHYVFPEIHAFASDKPSDGDDCRVVVFRLHAIVHDWRGFSAWLQDIERIAARVER